MVTFVGREKEVIRRRGENLSPARGGGGPRRAPARRGGGGRRGPVGPVRGGGQGLRRRDGCRQTRSTSTSCVTGPPSGWRRSRCHASGSWSTSCRTRRPAGWPSTGSRRAILRGARCGTGRTSVSDYPTSIGTSDADSITLLGQDLAADLLGQVGFGELAFWLVALRRPTAGRAAALRGRARRPRRPRPDAVGAGRPPHADRRPESIQGAVAAGILGGGSRFLGVTEDSARFLADALAAAACLPRGRPPVDDAGYDAIARALCHRPPGRRASSCRASGTPTTRSRTHVRRSSTPWPSRRACSGRTCGCSPRSAACTPRSSAAPCRSTAPASAARSWPTSGFDPDIIRGFALLARCAGLVGHIAEEQRRPIGLDLYADVHEATRYEAP